MKSIYIGLMIGMLCLLSNTTFAQIYQYSDDGSKAFIDPETGTGSRICFCNFVFQLNDFSQSLAASNDQYQWLLEQEELLKFDIEKRFNRTGNPYPNFTKAQFAFFNSFTPIANAGLDYRQRIQQNVEANINIDAASNQRYRTSKIKAETLSQWVRELASGGNRTHYFGDLKYEGQRIEDITDGLYLSREITQHTNAFNEELDKRRQLANIEDKLREAETRQIAEAVISDRFIGIYRDLPFKEAMEFMTEHMARDFEEVHPPMIDTYQFIIDNFGPDYENPLDKDYYNQIYNDIMDLSVGNPTTVTPYEVTPAEAIFEYALNEHVTPSGRSFLGEHQAVKDEVMSFSENNQYNQASLTNMSNLISANVEGRPALTEGGDNYDHYTNYPPTDPIWDLLNNNTQSVSFKNLMKSWHRPSFSVQNNGIIGYFNLVQDMQDAGVLHPRTEGHVIRASISHSYPDGVWNNLTNEELAQIFRVTSSSQTSSDSHWISILYDNNIGEIMFDNGYPNIEFLNSEFALQAALAIANNNGSTDGIYFEEQIIDSGLEGKAACINDLILKNGNSFVKNIMKNFEGDSEFGINIVSVDNIPGDQVCATTSSPVKGIIKIKVSSSCVQSSSALAVARNIIHEYLHADMFRKLKSNLIPTLEILNFKSVYEAFEEGNFQASPQHETMAKLYVGELAAALKDFHKNVLTDDYEKYVQNLGEPTDTFYEAISWEGLKNAGVQAWEDLSPERKLELENASLNLGLLTNSICSD